MDQSNSAKMATAKAPQLADMETSAATGTGLSPVERHLGLIKAMAIIMALLIFAALAVIVGTIYSRLVVKDSANTIQELELAIPANSRVISASLADRGQMLLILEDATGQQLWQVNRAGKVRRKTHILQTP